MNKKLLGIHGLANKPPRERLEEGWAQSIRDGLENIGAGEINVEFELIYWRDKIYKQPMHRDERFKYGSLYNTQPYQELNEPLQAYEDGLMDALQSQASGLIDPVASALKEFGVDKLSDTVIRNVEFLNDLDVYYNHEHPVTDNGGETRPADWVIRDELLIPLMDALEAYEEVLLLAHSMGTIIAYDVLRELELAASADALNLTEPLSEVDLHLVTFGSPLGLPEVQERIVQEREDDLEDPLQTPAVASSWTNFGDRWDKVAFDLHLRDDYGPNETGVQVEDDRVIKRYKGPDGERYRHKSYGYLRTPEVSNIISRLLVG